jgi:acylphosphatase
LICKRFLVKGKVQGVFYRQSTRTVALELGLSGWCRNLPDGNVEVQACGDSQSLSRFESWLQRGPREAVVEEVTAVLVEKEVGDNFEIRRF